MTDVENIVAEAESAIAAADTLGALDDVRTQYLGKKGQLTTLLKNLGQLSAAERQ